MAGVAHQFDRESNLNILHALQSDSHETPETKMPWETITSGAMPPSMFQVRFHDGKMIGFTYSDLHEVHCRDAGQIKLYLLSLQKIVITLEGRHLKELARWFCSAGVCWVQESDPRDLSRSESEPEITQITIHELSD